MLAISCKKGGGDNTNPNYFRITKTDGQTALVRSALSTNANNLAGNSNTQNIYVDIAERNSQGFSVSILSAQTNNGGDIKDFVSFTNRGSRYFLVVNDEIFTNQDNGYLINTTPTNLTVNYRVSATGSGYTGSTSYDYTINGTLQYATIIPNEDKDNTQFTEGSLTYALSNSYNKDKSISGAYDGDKYFYGKGGQFVFDQAHSFEIKKSANDETLHEITFKNNQDSTTGKDGVLGQDLADDIRQSIVGNTAGNFAKYFSDVKITYSADESKDGDANWDDSSSGTDKTSLAVFNVEFIPLPTYEMTNAANHKLYLKNFNGKQNN